VMCFLQRSTSTWSVSASLAPFVLAARNPTTRAHAHGTRGAAHRAHQAAKIRLLRCPFRCPVAGRKRESRVIVGHGPASATACHSMLRYHPITLGAMKNVLEAMLMMLPCPAPSSPETPRAQRKRP
jgi:hypothetical protein